MSSLYLSEVHSINLVKWIQRAKTLQTDTKLRTEDQMASQIGGEERRVDIKRRKRGKCLSHWMKKGGVRKEVLKRGIMKRAAVREMTRRGFHCQQLSYVKSSCFFFTARCHRTRRALSSLSNYAWRGYVKTGTYAIKNRERTKTYHTRAMERTVSQVDAYSARRRCHFFSRISNWAWNITSITAPC